MLGKLLTAGVLAVAVTMPLQPAAAQNPLGGAIGGGIVGGVIGGAVGGGRGAAIGAIVGATTGAAIASQGTRYRNGYYGYEGGCWLQRRDGSWIRVHPRYCY
jgi:outer membrane lipoprotein SlyB